MKIYLHIGVPKTGSTTIQTCLHENSSRLATRASCHVVQNLGQQCNSHLLAIYATRFYKGKQNFHLRRLKIRTGGQFAQLRDRVRREFMAQVAGSECERLIISSEAFSQMLRREDEIDRLAELLFKVSQDIKIIVYLRRQDEALLSAHSQQIKNGKVGPLRLVVPPEYLDYKPILDLWSAKFGRDKLEVGLIEKQSLKNGDLLDDFFWRCDISSSLIEKSAPVNPSLSSDALEYLRLMNQHFPALDEEKGGLNRLRGNMVVLLNRWSEGRPRLRLTSQQVETVMAQASPYNAAVAREYFNRTDGQLFAPPSFESIGTNGAVEPEPLRNEDLIAIAAHLWAAQQERIAKLQRHVKYLQDSAKTGPVSAGGGPDLSS